MIVGIVLILIGGWGVLTSTSSIFFGLLTSGVFLTFYGWKVDTQETAMRFPQEDLIEKESSLLTAFCSKCGTSLDTNDLYCPNCGEKTR